MSRAHTKPKEVGERIRARRFELGLSQRDIQEPGASYAYLSRIEHGTRNPTIEALIQIADKLDTTALWLLTGDTNARCPCCGVTMHRDQNLGY